MSKLVFIKKNLQITSLTVSIISVSNKKDNVGQNKKKTKQKKDATGVMYRFDVAQ